MTRLSHLLRRALQATAAVALLATPVLAQDMTISEMGVKSIKLKVVPTGKPAPKPVAPSTRPASYFTWMHGDVPLAWQGGVTGAGVTITTVDDFSSASRISGNLGDGSKSLRHGEWTQKESGMIAIGATIASHDLTNGQAVKLAAGFNVVNLSYGMMAQAGFNGVTWSAREASILTAAHGNTAFISKAAGNDYGTAVGQANKAGNLDYFGRDLIGAQGAVFVGALERNGTTVAPARLASYSNIAGDDLRVQDQFLVVGVDAAKTGLAGTSFAAPIVSGYGALIASKFKTDTPALVADRLLNTARTDTILGYSSALHGRGEASLSRALAPNTIQ